MGMAAVGRGYDLQHERRQRRRQAEQVAVRASETAVRGGQGERLRSGQGERCARRDREKVGRSCQRYGADTMARPPESRPAGNQPGRIATLPTRELRRWELPERPRVDAVLLHLEVQGLVVGSELPRRLALVPTGSLEHAADRLLLGVRCGRLGDLLQ